jgi:predicted translin family RNA/ssDNA-binding protein
VLEELSWQYPRPVVRQNFQVVVFRISERSEQPLQDVETSQETIALNKSLNIHKSLNDKVEMVKRFFSTHPQARSPHRIQTHLNDFYVSFVLLKDILRDPKLYSKEVESKLQPKF